MGITTALNTTVGSHHLHHVQIVGAACVAVSVSAEAEADAGVLGYAPALYNAYPNWPGVSTPYGSSTCYGCRPGYFYGKRSADAEPEAEADAYYGYPYGYGHYYGKRSADAEPEADALYAYAAPYAYG